MSDSQRPKPFAPSLEIPDLELAPAQPLRPHAAAAGSKPRSLAQGPNAPSMFEEESFAPGSLSLDLDASPQQHAAVFGASISFDEPGGFELERIAAPSLQLHGEAASANDGGRVALDTLARAAWPTGRAADPTQSKLDPIEVVILADYGPVPQAVQLTPAYAYRVFTRRRELKRQLLAITAESERAEVERETTLAELARAVRPAAQQIEQFRRLFAPLIELEQIASQRGQALSAIHTEQSTHTGQLDSEQSQIASQMNTELGLERDAQRAHDEREASAKRAEAKLKRVHIEIRAVTQVAEQKLGPRGGQIPDAEAAQLAALRQRAEGVQPELARAQAELARAKQALDQVQARLAALRHSERQNVRKKQAVGAQYQKELALRSQGSSESDAEQRTALADLGRAVLGAAGSVDVPPAWLERVRAVSERADKLLVRRELQRRAIDAFDQPRVTQGVRLACTVIGLIVVLMALKIAF